MRLRDPSPVLYLDSRACEVMCAGQLLHMHGFLDLDPLRLDEMVGRRTDEVDVTACATRLLFEHEFHQVVIDPHSTERAARDFDYWRGMLQEDLGEDALDEPGYAEAYQRALPLMRSAIALERQYAPQVTRLRRQATRDDFDRLLDEGHGNFVRLCRGSGWILLGLAYERDGDTYRVYDPGGCDDTLTTLTAEQMRSLGNFHSVNAWKPPTPRPS